MSEPRYIEDIFVQMYDKILLKKLSVDHIDKQPLISFYNVLIQGQRITIRQSSFILKLINKYSDKVGIEKDSLTNAVWKKEFRKIDTSRKAFVEKDQENGYYWICLKFPYQLKHIIEKELLGNGSYYYGDNFWDKERRIRKLKLNDYNIIAVHDFLINNNFELEESFFTALAVVEEIWQEQDNILPHSQIVDSNVILKNATKEALNFYNLNCTGNLAQDSFTAKTLGYPVRNISKTILDRLCCKSETQFWIKDFKNFFDVTEQINGKVAIVIDRNCDYIQWCKLFAASLTSYGIDRNNAVICFRTSNKDQKDFNDWVKDNSFAGKVENQKYLLFLQKPPKWLFKDNNNVKILATNNLFPNNIAITRDWLNSHPCVIYLSEFKPVMKDQKIVEL